MNSPEIRFVVGLLTTILLLVLVMWTGKRRARRAHITLVVTAVAALGVTIYFAERLGEVYDIRAAGVITPIHLFLAKLTTAFYLAPITTGILTLRRAKVVRYHRWAAYTVLTLTVVTAGTGTAMILLAEPLLS
ncbi:MAG: hypothetical protein WD226_11680 [Planctomycetota bacterium]